MNLSNLFSRTYEMTNTGHLNGGFRPEKVDALCHFSGGKDCRLAITAFLDQNPDAKLILTTYDTGCNYYNQKTMISSIELMEKNPNIVKHVIIDIASIYKELVLKNLERYTIDAGFLFTCIPCKFLFLTYSIYLSKKYFYARYIVSGARNSGYYPDQMKEVLMLMADLAEENEIKYHLPVYHFKQNAMNDKLVVEVGRFRNLCTHVSQASCMFGGCWFEYNPEKKEKALQIAHQIKKMYEKWLEKMLNNTYMDMEETPKILERY